MTDMAPPNRPKSHDAASGREFFTLKQIADAARSEAWPTGRALEESRKLLRRRRVTRNRQTGGTRRA